MELLGRDGVCDSQVCDKQFASVRCVQSQQNPYQVCSSPFIFKASIDCPITSEPLTKPSLTPNGMSSCGIEVSFLVIAPRVVIDGG